jgi:hypothetical protein
LIDRQDMADGDFVSGGVHHDFLDQKTNNLFALRKACGSQVGIPPVGKHSNLLNQL